ncbi:unnamed protein product [Dimorphilus gyrociliatus]|uniref:Uncharacterized protein n=1 Tax=Dimorphilus gyrociliatus TaxID=2664684 RepID=A0A7I8WBE9_9ANNE|nr:unnamed protein product [Dimorphilus gyrociliatus]
MNSLEELSMWLIRKNLCLMSRVCKSYADRLPPRISEKIWEYCCEDNIPFSEDELEFFSSNYLRLTEVSLKRRKFLKIKNLNFLQNHRIKKLSLFKFQSLECLCIDENINNLELHNCTFTSDGYAHLGNSLMNCACLKSFMLTCATGLSDEYLHICKGLETTASSLQKIDFSSCNLSFKQGVWLSDLLKKCNSLQDINLSCNDSFADGFKDICDGLKCSSSSLLTIQVANCGLNGKQTSWLGDLLTECTKLKKFNLSGNCSFENNFEKICNGLKSSSSSLLVIEVCDCNLSDLSEEDGLQLGNLLKDCTSLQEIDLKCNQFFDNAFENICIGLKSSSSSLLTIQLGDCDLDEKQCSFLSELLAACTHLQEIDLTENFGVGDVCKRICNGLQSSASSLTVINVWCSNLPNNQGVHLGNLLKRCTKLREIDLTLNENLDEAFEGIFNGLKSSSSTLRVIKVESCQLNWRHCDWLSELLTECNQLQEINLSDNDNLQGGFEKICNSLKFSSSSLLSISLSNCNLYRDQCVWLSSLLAKCNQLRDIDLSWNSGFPGGFERIFHGLRGSSYVLLRINVADCQLSDKQGHSLYSLLKQCPQIEEVDLTDNKCVQSVYEKMTKELNTLSASSLLSIAYNSTTAGTE